MNCEKTEQIKILEALCQDAELLYRDCNLSDYEKHYIPGIVLREKAFVDAVRSAGGPVTTHRVVILSKKFADLSLLEDFGMDFCVIPKDSYFKVLDVYEEDICRVIVLVHLPDNNWSGYFAADINRALLFRLRERICRTLYMPPLPELIGRRWLDRCSFPLGLDDNGNYFPLSDPVG